MTDVVLQMTDAALAAQAYVAQARRNLAERLAPDGRVLRAELEAEQHAAHGLSWFAALAETLTQTAAWAARLSDQGRFGEAEALPAGLLFHEYLASLAGGVSMSQGEVVRPADLGVSGAVLSGHVETLAPAASQAAKHRIVELLAERRGRPTLEDTGVDELLDAIRDQFHDLAQQRIAPHAQAWHLADRLIPLELVEELGDLGVFGLALPEDWGGAGLGKAAMCVVSEELSRGYLGVGSLATRSEIAGELILGSGTEAQKAKWLTRIASGEVLPTAVFTEPDAGSDLAGVRTRAVQDADGWRLTGSKTWITHAARADLMTVLARTGAAPGHRGLSMILAPKPRGEAFAPGLSGTEIPVIGYRGMKEYSLSFDGFLAPPDSLLGGEPGQGFAQLMATFESARIQTAARAIGVAQASLDLALDYALLRRQFDKPIASFPRVANKLAIAAAEILGARQLAYYAARAKDAGKRCDLEAGMAKLMAARIAWAAADNGVQIHGGAGFALEAPASRLLADARILNIFEGAGEIQAEVIARRLLEAAN
jgi:(2S)-methylsuccinyl-CoA dehydrogenase